MVPCSDATSSGLFSLFDVIDWLELPRIHEFVLNAHCAIGLEVAFVTFHLTVSVVTIFMNMPLIFRTLSGKRAAIFLKI